MKTKEEVIREAYGVCWDQVKEFVDEDGWCSDCQIDLNNKGYNTWLEYIPADCKEMHIVYGEPEYWYRPKSLSGIENNNGWIRIESEEDLPKDSFNYYAFCSNGSVMTFNDFEYYKEYIIPELKVTHYQPIVKPKYPIY